MLSAIALACLAAALAGGRDAGWDLYNYYLYAPHSLFAGRLSQDFMAASVQSYLNPLPLAPLYAMVSAGWHSLAIAAVLALAHACALALVYAIARQAGFFAGAGARAGALLALLLAAACIPFWHAVGRSGVDILVALPVLAAVWLYACGRLGHRPALEAAALGLLLGAGAGLKLTNAIYVLAGLCWPLLLGASAGQRLRLAALFAAAAALGGLATGGAWAWLLWREFSNPVFPLFNALFRSPDFPAVDLFAGRYLDESLAGAAALPFRIAAAERWVYYDFVAPDLRLAALLPVLAAWGFVRWRGGDAPRLGGTVAFFLVALAAWIVSSSNARYGMALLLLGGLLLAATLRSLLAPRLFLALAGAALAVQCLRIAEVSPVRRSIAEPYAWTRELFELRFEERLRREPQLFLSTEMLTYAGAALFAHPASAFVNLRGQWTPAPDGPGAARARRLIEGHPGRLRWMGREPADAGATLAAFGLAIDPADCSGIANPSTEDGWSRLANRFLGVASRMPEQLLQTCRLVPVDAPPSPGRQRADRLFDAAERACPQRFTPGLAGSALLEGNWSRFYLTTDRWLVLKGDTLHAADSHGDMILGAPCHDSRS